MKVEGPKSPSPVQAGRSTRGTSRAGSNFASHLRTGDAAAPAATVSGNALTSVDALIALQATPEAGQADQGDGTEERARRKRTVARGANLLDRLEEIRHGMLLGQMPLERLHALQTEMRDQRETVADPRLIALIDEIELRCAVELAKLGF